MSLSLRCWLQASFLGLGQGSGAGQSTKLSGVCSGPLGWEGQNTHGQLCWFFLSPRTWRGWNGGRATSPLSLLGCLSPAVLFYLPPSSLHLSSSSPLPPGCLADFLLYFSCLFSLLSHCAQLLLIGICQPTFVFLVFSTVFSDWRVNREERWSPLLCASLGMRWFLDIFLIVRARLVLLRWGNGMPGSVALHNLVQEPKELSYTVSHHTSPGVVVKCHQPWWDVRGVVEVLRSRPQTLSCTVLSSLISPSEHTASSHTSTVKCGCFNHWRESLILLLQHIAASPAPGTTGSLLLPVLNWFQKH